MEASLGYIVRKQSLSFYVPRFRAVEIREADTECLWLFTEQLG